jgi:uncharacterized RDD family membrane protein YckC
MEIFITKSGAEAGPFTEDQIKPMLDSGMLSPADLIWHKDLTEWTPLYQYLGIRPPIPVVPAQPHPHARQAAAKKEVGSGDAAPFGRRLCAHLIDLLTCSVLTLAFGFVVFVVFGGIWATLNPDDSSSPHNSTRLVIEMTLFTIIYFSVLIIPTWLYHALSEKSANQATMGKLACGLIVTDMEGNRINFARASKRALGKAASLLLGFGLIFLTSLFSRKGQCLHDLRAGCKVVVK